MKPYSFLFALLCSLAVNDVAAQNWISYEPKKGPGQGKHVVFLTGDEEYRSEEGLPMLAKILSQRHGFKCTVLFAIDPDGTINPDNSTSVPGISALDSADAIVMLLRYRAWPDEAMKHFVDALERGVPIIALRTSTHAFNYPANSPTAYKSFNTFGKKVLGEEWVNHWGRHKQEATRGILEPSALQDPILRGVAEIFGDTDVYEAYPPADAKILVRGQVLAGMKPSDPPANYRKKRADQKEQGINDPMMAVAWTRLDKNASGKENRIFCTTLGSATDLQNEGLRRLVVNAVYGGLGLPIPAKADVAYVDEYRPTMYGFKGYRRGLRPSDHALGKVLPAAATSSAGAAASAPAAGAGTNLAVKAEVKGDDLLKPPPRPRRPELAPSAVPLALMKSERIALVGGSLAERMNLFGHFEALLHSRFPQQQLVVRNFGRPADEVGKRQRPDNYTKLDDPLSAFGPDTIFCFFGFNESYAGPSGLGKFKEDYRKFLDEFRQKYPRDDAGSPARFVLISPIAFEPTGDRLLPDGREENANLKLYAGAVAEVARERQMAFIDLFTPTEGIFAEQPGMQFTINGAHLNEAGDRQVAQLLDQGLFSSRNPAQIGSRAFAQLRAAVNDKSWIHEQDYRMLDGWYVYGGRRTFDTETFPREYLKIRNMAAVRDRYIWDLAQGKSVPPQPDDSNTGELYVPPTRFGDPRQSYSEPKELRYLTPEELIQTMTLPPGFEVQPFADERKFPELTKPVQLGFDNKGRLWVSCMPTYPLWKPGDPKPSDRLLIFEDKDGDGKADTCKVFYDKLHCPTGFEFWNGGVLVVDQPRILFLKDTDGDDKADVVEHWLDGWASDDTHHTVGAFEWSHGGLLHMLEGISMSTTVETPWGPFRNYGSSGTYIVDPRTLKIRHFNTPTYGNPWCYVFNWWGQGICGDGTGAHHHWDSPLSGAQFSARRSMDPVFDNQGMRPAVGSEFLYTRQFPDEVQGQFIYACVINMNGIPRFEIHDNGSGYSGSRLMKDGVDDKGEKKRVPDDLLRSTDKNFRPTDPQIGPDGAIWFGDWCNALIGHMQYSQRDPNRDHTHGRLYRLVYTGKPLLKPVTQFGKPEMELLDQLKIYETRTRYAARRELRDRPTAKVLAAIKTWVARLDRSDPQYERLLCEALWVEQGHHAVDEALLRQALGARMPEARAAAVHLVSDESAYLPDAYALLKPMVKDSHPRVRLEAIRALSFYPTTDSVELALDGLNAPTDYWLNYTIESTVGALQPVWQKPLEAHAIAAHNPKGLEFLEDYELASKPGGIAAKHLKILLNNESKVPDRNKAYQELSRMKGNAANGKAVFGRICIVCHKIGNEGIEYGPDLTKVASRLNPHDLMESVIDPNAKLDPKYVTTNVETKEGEAFTGFITGETPGTLTLRIAGGKDQAIPITSISHRETVKQSSMPEGLAATLSAVEFLDLVEYLKTLK